MKQTLTILLVALSAFSVLAQRSPLAKYSAEWNDPKYRVCNTAKNTPYLSEKEKEIIHILNLARMNPQLFCTTVVSNARQICNADTSSEKYYKSLVTTLMAMKPAKIMNPDTVCYSSAKAHAVTSGESGYTGHERQTPESSRKKTLQWRMLPLRKLIAHIHCNGPADRRGHSITRAPQDMP